MLESFELQSLTEELPQNNEDMQCKSDVTGGLFSFTVLSILLHCVIVHLADIFKFAIFIRFCRLFVVQSSYNLS